MKFDADLSRVTLAILAGGAGRRMGLPKGRLEISGRPILEYMQNRFAWIGPTLLVTAPGREHPPGWDRFDDEAIDAVENEGPLRGVLTALEIARTEVVAIATVDMPGIGDEQLRWLMGKLVIRPDLLGCMINRAVDGKREIEPFPFVCRRDAAAVISRRLKEGQRSVFSLADVAGFSAESAPENWPASVWMNLNSPEDLKLFLRSVNEQE